MTESSPTAPAIPTGERPAKKIWQSATRNETYATCSQLYAARYIYKLPDPGNDGSKRGNVCHNTLELLLKPRHRKVYEAAIHHQTCTEVPALWRLICAYARKEGVADPKNLKTIDGFMMVALTNEFLGEPGTFERIPELPFELEVDEPDGRRFRTKGFVDQLFKVRDKDGILLSIKDFKSSKAFYDGEKAELNGQAIMYQIAARRLFPEIKRRRFRFCFLKFKTPWQEMEPFTDEQLDGYEWQLTAMQQALESFTLANEADNLAAFDQEKQWLCGVPDALKKDGTPRWCCSAHKPLDYWAIVDAQGEIVKSGYTREELESKVDAAKGQRIEERHYAGCKAWWNKGRRRNFQ